MNGGGWGGRMWVVGVYAFLYVPILCLIVFSFTAGEITTRFDGFSLRWYAALARCATIGSWERWRRTSEPSSAADW